MILPSGWHALQLVSLAAFTYSASISGRTVHERRSSVPNGYTTIGPANVDSMLTMRIGLTMGNRTGLESAVSMASNPQHENYGQWLSQEDIQYYAAPTREALHSVRKWLSSYNVDSQSVTVSGDWLKLNISVGTANAMLSTTYNLYEYTATGKQYIRTLQYSVPDDVKEYIVAIHPTTSFNISPSRQVISISGHHKSSSVSAQALPSAPAASSFANCNETVTPACIQQLYGFPSTLIGSTTESTLAVTALLGEDANKADLTSFLELFRPDMASDTTFATQLFDDASNSQILSDAGLEANLDIQYTVGLANGIPETFVDFGSDNQDGSDGGFLDIANDLLAEKNPPLVLSTSYTLQNENELSESLTLAMCDAYMKLAARGVSILFATGDGGVGSTPGLAKTCTAGDAFLVPSPLCPYITFVGATQNIPVETAADLSAGGFSNYFPQPAWQQNAAATYLKAIGNLNSGLFNPAGRGYPDVSAQGTNIQIFQSGLVVPVDGTSASTPIFASAVALLNDELIANGKAPLGFLNPWLYAHPEMFNDITTGSNPGCGTEGFPALEGWDPVTGLGSPNYQAMRAALGLS